MRRTRIEYGPGTMRRIVLDGGHKYSEKSDSRGVFFDEQPAKAALRDWSYGEWKRDHEIYSSAWSRHKGSFDLAGYRSRLRLKGSIPETPEQVAGFVSLMMADVALRPGLLLMLLDTIKYNDPRTRIILRYWSNSPADWMASCPFAKYCCKAILLFYISVSGGLININPTNMIDLEYLMYLPFCSAFVSGDLKTHGRLAPLLLDSDQRFINSNDYKADLSSYDANSPSCCPIAKQVWEDRFGSGAVAQWPPRELMGKSREAADSVGPEALIAGNSASDIQKVVKEIESNRDKYPKPTPWPGLA